MTITLLLSISVALPMLMALALSLHRFAREGWVARAAQGTSALSALASAVAVGLWITSESPYFATTLRDVYAHDDYHFTFGMGLDRLASVFLLLVQFITSMVMRFSRFYMHRERGFQRFFATVLLFQGGMCLLAVATNLQVMFAGWEIVGVASFLLIAFYWERQSAVRNALKTYSVYRVADIGMLLAACLAGSGGHHAIGLLLLLAAMGKSAQFPFSFWIPRAMEGPTPSSALFYGGLSVHAGAYLLLRTAQHWDASIIAHTAVGAVGLITAVTSSMFSRVQPTIKGQIGYASVTQVGIIFVEIALGLHTLALVHLVANALLRCYQLLVSPSAVAYMLRRHASTGAPAPSEARSLYARLLSRRARSTLYAFVLNEGHLKDLVKSGLWVPLRRLGAIALSHRTIVLISGACAALATGITAHQTGSAPALAGVMLGVALVFSACGLSAWQRPLHVFEWLACSSLAIALAVYAVAPARAAFAAEWDGLLMIVSCALAGLGVGRAAPRGARISRFAGLSEAHPVAAACALVGALGIAGFPLLPTFLGEDLLLHATLSVSLTFAVLVAALLALNGYLAIRTFAFTFFGRYVPPAPREAAVGEETLKAPLALSQVGP